VDFALAGAERGVFEAQIALEAGQFQKAGETAWQAMLRAAQGLVSLEVADVPSDPDRIVAEFRSRFYDTQKFFDPFAARNFGQYFFSAHEKASEPYTEDSARFRIDEAHLFLEAAHNCSQRITAAAAEQGKGIPA
jgi:sulfite reductase (ferredoxin)